MVEIKHIVIHAADTFPDMDIGAKEIRQWHKEKGWSDIGYHYVIRRNGTIENGRRNQRDNYIAGAHVLGLNSNSLGICMVGGKARSGQLQCNYTRHQWSALEHLWRVLSVEWPNAKWSGHNDHDKAKQCPTFDVSAWLQDISHERDE